MSPARVTPVLAGSEHDNEGRLVGLTYDSTPPLSAPDTNPWLVAVDGSDNALCAVAHAAGNRCLRRCSRTGARLAAFDHD